MQAALGGSKASAKPTDPKPFLVTLRLVLSMSEVEVFSVTTQNIAEDTPPLRPGLQFWNAARG